MPSIDSIANTSDSIYNFLNEGNIQIKVCEIDEIDKHTIKKRGFIVKNLFSIIDLLKSFLICNTNIFLLCIIGIVPIGILAGFPLIFPEITLGEAFGKIIVTGYIIWAVLIPYFHFFKNILFYILFGKVVYTSKGLLLNNGKFKDLNDLYLFKGINIFYIKFNNSWGTSRFKWGIIIWINLFFIFIAGLIFGINFFISIISLLGIIFILRFIVQIFHPLYSFGNPGEKIQKLTPTIESKSKEIQENFEKDTNFRTLSEGFDSLSSTFSEIVGLVIKLERVEKKANKGNLFDSEKYINSLRGDIVEPLQLLKLFLEGQRKRLGKNQKELQRVQVRVGGDTALTSESELSSKRGESLIIELDENISKLNEMIKKMNS